ncbi:MAG: ABC transporter ATP-binding protein [Acidimicrobiia bacterium]
MSLDAQLGLRIGTLDLDVGLRARTGETVAVIGPNGAGKTTALRALAGLAPIDNGYIRLDGETLDDGGAINVPPERRSVAVVFQDYLLFPHLTALDNVAFGLRSRGVGRNEARRAARSALERVGLDTVADARPRTLSGGQRQRVALARALATEPALLLLDEPLAALDQSARGAVRRELRQQLSAVTGVRILVTHDPFDAAALADRLVIVESGRVVQTGLFAEISARPRSAYVADLVGVNLVRGIADGNRVQIQTGGALIVATAISGAVSTVFHPRAVSLHADAPTGSPRNVMAGHVTGIERLGDRVRVQVAGPIPMVAEVTPAALADLALVEGSPVWTALKATDITVFPS